jgi:N-acetylglucosaminyldiphosphoundecaprenol N-acetyl-beta-D-mannosaminyltransferase
MSLLSPTGQARPTEATWHTPAHLSILGVRVDRLALHDLLRLISQWVAEAHTQRACGEPVRTRQIVTLNPEIVMAARRDANLRALINGADLVLADGVGIVLAARLRGVRGLVRLTGVDTVRALAACASATGWRLYLLGAQPGVAAQAAEALVARHPGLQIAGTHAGAPSPELDDETTHRVRATNADIVCVAYGAPAQERWIARNAGALGAAVAVGVGGTFDFLAGRVPRAPVALQRVGLEWAYRLWREPWRWRRMLALPRFALAAACEALRTSRTRRNAQILRDDPDETRNRQGPGERSA